jgi:hypothetical protein
MSCAGHWRSLAVIAVTTAEPEKTALAHLGGGREGEGITKHPEACRDARWDAQEGGREKAEDQALKTKEIKEGS